MKSAGKVRIACQRSKAAIHHTVGHHLFLQHGTTSCYPRHPVIPPKVWCLDVKSETIAKNITNCPATPVKTKVFGKTFFGLKVSFFVLCFVWFLGKGCKKKSHFGRVFTNLTKHCVFAKTTVLISTSHLDNQSLKYRSSKLNRCDMI